MTSITILILGRFLSKIGACFSLLLSEPARTRLLGPKLRIENVSGGGDKNETSNSFVLKLRVINKGSRAARGCRAFLTEVRTTDENNISLGSVSLVGLRLDWASKQKADLDIYPEVPYLVDFASHCKDGGLLFGSGSVNNPIYVMKEKTICICDVAIVSKTGVSGRAEVRLCVGGEASDTKVTDIIQV